MSKLSKRHSISIKAEAYTRLTTQGKFGESFTDLINRLVDNIESNEIREKEIQK